MRSALTVREASFLLQRPEMVIRRMADSGTLVLVGERTTSDGRRRCFLSPASVREAFPNDGAERLRRFLLVAILAGRFRVPPPSSRWGTPLPLEAAAEAIRA
jgi:hypothetical protein